MQNNLQETDIRSIALNGKKTSPIYIVSREKDNRVIRT